MTTKMQQKWKSKNNSLHGSLEEFNLIGHLKDIVVEYLMTIVPGNQSIYTVLVHIFLLIKIK